MTRSGSTPTIVDAPRDARTVLAAIERHGVRAADPWQPCLAELPARIQNHLTRAGLATITQVVRAAYESPSRLLLARGFGGVSLAALRDALERLARRGLPDGLRLRHRPRSLRDFTNLLFAELDDDARALAECAYLHAMPRSELAAERGSTRQAIAARLKRIEASWAVRYGLVAGELVTPLAGELDRRGGVMSSSMVSAHGVATAGLAALLLRLAGRPAYVWRRGFVSKLTPTALEARLRHVLQQARQATPDQIEDLWRDAGFDLPGEVREKLAAAAGLHCPMDDREAVERWLVRTVAESLRPISLSELTERFAAPRGQPAGRLLYEIAESSPELWPVEHVTYMHARHLPVSPDVIERVARRAVARLAGERGPWSARLLLKAVGGRHAADIPPAALRHAMLRHPDIIGVEGHHLVAHRASYREADVTMLDRLAQVLGRATRPLSVPEIEAALPKGVEYSRGAIERALAREPWAVDTGDGHYVHARHARAE